MSEIPIDGASDDDNAFIGPHSEDERFHELFSKANLRKTWVQVRREMRELDVRDVIDWLDWSCGIERNLEEIRCDVIAGRYQPLPPNRHELGKAKGSFRLMTTPNIRDALVYRHISDEALNRASPFSIKGAYFSRRRAATPVGKSAAIGDDPYDRFFEVWIRYNEYRTRTLLSAPHEVLVTTDISNYFDSIEHDLLLEYLAPLGLPRKAVALLGRLLEVLKPTAGHSPNPRVGLPVDEFDCSRQLAHFFLFEHDHNIIRGLGAGGEDRYVRWMDDQNVGVASLTEARRVVNLLTRSLQQQRLTLNSGKTKFLSPEEVVVEFHLDANEALSAWDAKWKKAKYSPKGACRSELAVLWKTACINAEKGHWDKILKRFYASSVTCAFHSLEADALQHVVHYPAIAPRVFTSLAKQGRTSVLFDLFESYVASGESLFEATESAFFEALLTANLTPHSEKAALSLAQRYLDGSIGPHSQGELGRASAVLAYYWLGGKLADLTGLLGAAGWTKVSAQVGRSVLAITAALNPASFRDLVVRFVGNPSDDISRIAEFITAILAGEIGKLSFNFAHLRPRWPEPGKHYDARAWLQLELLSRTADKSAIPWLKGEIGRFEKYAKTRQEKRVLSRIRKRIKP